MKYPKIVFLFLAALFWPLSFFFANSSGLVINKNSIFVSDPLAYDTQVKKVSQIPNRVLARTVQNKFMIYLDKYSNNLFNNLDLNNYFFSFHPRETANYQSINKFPYLALPIFLLGLFSLISRSKFRILKIFGLLILCLSFFDNLDKWNIILWPVILAVIIKGGIYFEKKYPKQSFVYFLIAIIFTLFDFARIFFLKT